MEDTYNMNFPSAPSKSADDFDHTQTLTRGEFVMEQLQIWEEQTSAINRALARGGQADHERHKLLARQMDMKIAIRVLKNTYFASELTNMDFYEEEMKEVPSASE